MKALIIDTLYSSKSVYKVYFITVTDEHIMIFGKICKIINIIILHTSLYLKIITQLFGFEIE